MRVTFILGGPGSGKSTQCRLLAEKYNLTHLSVGDLLRSEKSLAPIIRKGDLVLSETTLDLIQARIKGVNEQILLDGFPRSLENLFMWKFRMKGLPPLIYLDCSEQELRSRTSRRSREDDLPETLNRRLKTFYEQTLPILEMYQRCYPDHLTVINAQKPKDQIFKELSRLFE